jgi:hypothetical protein
VVGSKSYLPYVSGLKVLIPVIDAWARSREVIRQDVVKCLEEPRLGMAWVLGSWSLGGGGLTRCYAIAIGACMRRPGVHVTKQVLLSSAQQSKGPDAFICFSKDLIDRTMYSVEQSRRIRSLIAQQHIAHDRSGSTYLDI